MSSLMDGTLGSVVAFLLALGVIVSVHEYGHYIVGRWCGIHAEVFSLGFGPVLLSKYDKRGTKWQISMFPLGGYVKFTSEPVGEGLPKNLKTEETITGASLLKRTLTVAAGPFFNFLFSILVFSSLFLYSGTVSQDAVIGNIKTLPGSVKLFNSGDQILKVEGIPVDNLANFISVSSGLSEKELITYEIKRNEDVFSFKSVFPFPPLIDRLHPQSAALEAGLKAGDLILEVNSTSVYGLSSVQRLVNASQGGEIKLKIWRNGTISDIFVTPRRYDLPGSSGYVSKWLIGFSGGLFFEPVKINLSLKSSVYLGVMQTKDVVISSLMGLKSIIAGSISSCNLQGPIGIAQVAGDISRQGLVDFIWFVALLSTSIGLLNLFPIPILDGGHLVFFFYEAVTGRPVNSGVTKALMVFGMVLLGGLMIFSLSNDLLCT
jgi:regulator of sigma E protease